MHIYWLKLFDFVGALFSYISILNMAVKIHYHVNTRALTYSLTSTTVLRLLLISSVGLLDM